MVLNIEGSRVVDLGTDPLKVGYIAEGIKDTVIVLHRGLLFH